MFDDDGYTGSSTYMPNAYEVNNDIRNSFSSVRVNPGCEFQIFEHADFGGQTAIYPAELGQGVHEYELGSNNIIGNPSLNWNTLGFHSYRCNCGGYPEGTD